MPPALLGRRTHVHPATVFEGDSVATTHLDALDNAQKIYGLKGHLGPPWRNVANEPNILQILVPTKLLPITRLSTSEGLIGAIGDVFKYYRELYEATKFVHGDINPQRIMYRHTEGKICGILTDYDFTPQISCPGLRGGALSYMAIDFLDVHPIKQLYRHDLESLLYVLLIITTGSSKSQRKKNPLLKGWLSGSQDVLSLRKQSFLSEPFQVKLTTRFKRLQNLVFKLAILFGDGYNAQKKHVRAMAFSSENQIVPLFDNETLGGYVDFDSFEAILLQPIE